MATTNHGDQRGNVKDPEHDGRLKENREAGRTKGTTPGSAARSHEHGHESSKDSRSHAHEARHEGGHEGSGKRGEHSVSPDRGGDLKSREYKDAQGETHHHTKSYMEQHKKS